MKLLPEYVGESFDTDAWKACLTDGILRLVIDAYDQAQSLISDDDDDDGGDDDVHATATSTVTFGHCTCTCY